ncbi:MAG: Crp/Fnr family transcriptional regulator [Paraglaciecola sp.]|nr:Crp/Fnr family transcriptional regulator [Paraglaciecola sp.]NCT46890.1 Crp/Fnr family transcriptional regulator [Paraglaciecola sp.]
MSEKIPTSLLQIDPWLASLPAEIMAAIVDKCKSKTLIAGQYLHRKNDPGDALYCVLEGKIRVSNVSSGGQELILTWLAKGSWFGEISLFDGLPRTHDAIAEQDTHLLKLSNHDFHSLLNAYPSLYPHFMRLLCQRLRTTFNLLDDIGSLSLKQQLCRRLLMLADGFQTHLSPQSDSPITLNVSQDALALLLHSSRQTINKLLQELQHSGAVTLKYGQLTIKNRAQLTSLCMT